MKCNYCGKEIPDDSVFCEHCGMKMEKKVGKEGIYLLIIGAITIPLPITLMPTFS